MNALHRLLAGMMLAWRAVGRHRLRASLTILGIVIGVAAVVTVTALASGASETIGSQMSNLGMNAMIVFPRTIRASGAQTSEGGSRLGELDADALVQESTSIKLATPFLRSAGTAIYEGENVPVSVVGPRLAYFEIRNWKLTRGEVWTATQESRGEKVIVIGSETAKQLFGPLDPLGRSVRIGRYPYRVLGVLEPKGTSPWGANQDEIVVMPMTTMRSHLVPVRRGETHGILMAATSAGTTERAKKQAEAILRQRHRIVEGSPDDFKVRTQAEYMAKRDAMLGALSALLIGIAAVSLVVGGIGVMNVMLVSVTERTREIGIRMAIGAREDDILLQFLLEAIVLATIGGIVGVLLGYSLIALIGKALDWPMRMSNDSLVLALAVSAAIGFVFGFFPARRAARLDPVLALGRE